MQVTLLRSCRDANVVQFLGACIVGPRALLVTELLELGDLWRGATWRSARSGRRVFGWWQRGARAAADVAKGLHYLHTRKVVHLVSRRGVGWGEPSAGLLTAQQRSPCLHAGCCGVSPPLLLSGRVYPESCCQSRSMCFGAS